jgi:hypothetical protein
MGAVSDPACEIGICLAREKINVKINPSFQKDVTKAFIFLTCSKLWSQIFQNNIYLLNILLRSNL